MSKLGTNSFLSAYASSHVADIDLSGTLCIDQTLLAMITIAVPSVLPVKGQHISAETLLQHDKNPNTIVVACTST